MQHIDEVNPMKFYRRVLTIAGSDSGGGAGIQADLKTIAACGCYGTSAITAITAQNTIGVTDIHSVPVATLEAQIRAVLDDIGTDAVKLGMLHSVEIIECVSRLLDEYKITDVVLDPVMVATSGDKLIEDDAIEALTKYLLPRARIITPNIPEAEILTGTHLPSAEDLEKSAVELGRTHRVSVLAKGGHLAGDELLDVLYDHQDGRTHHFSNRKRPTNNTHGTGCTLSSAIASFIAKGLSVAAAAENGIAFVAQAIHSGAEYELGSGHGPVHHFHEYWK